MLDYSLNGYWAENGDPRIAHYPLMSGGPGSMLGIITAYVILVKLIGPILMRNRQPYQLRKTLIFYNVYNVLANGWFFFESIRCLDYGRKLYDFEFPSSDDRSELAMWSCKMVYIYMLSKLIDLADTVFFVLRKKDNQASFLHVYHHAIVPIIMWMGVKLMPSAGPAGLFPLFNSFIHAIMYGYYTMTALGPQYRSMLFWKKYITVLQLVQFVAYIAHSCLFLAFQTGYPSFIVYASIIQNPFFFLMFYQFYTHTYGQKKPVVGGEKNGKVLLKSD